MPASNQLDQNFKTFLQRIDYCKKKYPTAAPHIQLLAVSKTFGTQEILQLHSLGQKDFAENYVNEAISKIDALAGYDLTWHFIGHLQSNKAKTVAKYFAWVHSLDNIKTAQKLNAARAGCKDKLNVLIQVNIQNDPRKHGLESQNVDQLVKEILQLPNLKLRGLMGILKVDSQRFEDQVTAFKQLRNILHHINLQYELTLDTLSMGMSNDYEAAIAAGSTILRIGSLLFGTRSSTSTQSSKELK